MQGGGESLLSYSGGDGIAHLSLGEVKVWKKRGKKENRGFIRGSWQLGVEISLRIEGKNDLDMGEDKVWKKREKKGKMGQLANGGRNLPTK